MNFQAQKAPYCCLHRLLILCGKKASRLSMLSIFVLRNVPTCTKLLTLILDVPEMSSLRAMPSRVYTGSNLTITCSAIGSPTPRYRFYHKNGTIVQDSFAASYSTVLRYEDYPDYSATFKCVPYNVIGEGAAQNVTVEILGE